MKNKVFARLFLFIVFLHPFISPNAQSVSGVINSYYRVTAVNVAPNSVTVSSAAGLTPGVKVLVIQMKGATINQTNSNSFGNINAIGSAGNYEFNYVCGVVGDNVLLQNTMIRSYDASGSVQLVTVPRYTSVTVTDTVRATPWNAATGTGGVVVIEALDTVYLNSAISASGRGFSGGASISFPTPTYNCVWTTDVADYFLSLPPNPNLYYTGGWKGEGIANYMVNGEYGRGKQANGGGGGNNHNSGGAGGANYGVGGEGGRRSHESFVNCHGTNPGVGGLSLAGVGYGAGANNRIFMGGGGGTGHMNNNKGTPGANGGGIIIINADVLRGGGGRLLANGDRPFKAGNYDPYTAEGDGAGGGGAGGTIIINANVVSGPVTAEVKGGAGSSSSLYQPTPINECLGPGGGGGGGVIWAKMPGFPPTVTDSVAGGINGVVSMLSNIAGCRGSANGATAGANGTRLSNYIAPVATSFACAPLASANLLQFEGRIIGAINLIQWKVATNENIASYHLQRSTNQVDYETISILNRPAITSMLSEDRAPITGVSYYRLMLVYKNSVTEYSKIIALTRVSANLFEWVSTSPNPANSFAKVSLNVIQPGTLQLSILNPKGQQVHLQKHYVSKGFTSFNLPVHSLVPGIYFVSLEIDGKREVRKLIVNGR